MILAIYIDDGLIAAEDDEDIGKLIEQLQSEFEMKVFDVHVFLGLEIHQLDDFSVHINQASYTKKVLKKFNMIDAVPVSTPAETTLKSEYEKESDSVKIIFPFREAVGSLMYLKTSQRPRQ